MKTLISTIIDEELLPVHINSETNFEFIQRICTLCLDEIESQKGYSPQGFGDDVINEIELAVTEVFKMKTYGFYNLSSYRKEKLKKRIA
jgi:hypothetical protein